MKLLLTSDWQAEMSNLSNCDIALAELLAAADKYKPNAIIHAGDLKEHYSPVHVPVIKWWVKAVRQIKDAGHRLIILKGNHDRISQSDESKDWLDILRAAGAETVSKPKVKQVGNGLVAFLPYVKDKKVERQWAKQLRRECLEWHEPIPRVLVFHTEISGAIMNASGTKAEGNKVWDLLGSPDHKDKNWSPYDAAFGGHLHTHQEVSNSVYYIGSPFTHDWNECNETKGHVVADISAGMVNVKQIYTSIPRWFDVDYLEDNNLDPEDGAYIRSKLPVTSKKITSQIREEEERIRRFHQGTKNLQIFVIPKVEQAKTEEIVLAGSTDQQNVENYVAKTLNEAAGFTAGRVVAYLASKLAAEGSTGPETSIRYQKIEAHNVLSFQSVKFRYSGQGLVLVKGQNKDWPKQSNGAGKSNLLNLLPVAMFGETLKGQKNDAWANEKTDETAVVALTLRNARNHKICARRCRRPHSVSLYVDNKDRSTGITGKGKQETQGQIEKITGFDLHLLKNSVYIDQTIANGFVFGTQKGRLDLMNKILNLQRFEGALKAVNNDAKTAEEARDDVTRQLERLQERREDLKQDIAEASAQVEKDWTKQWAAAKREVIKLKEEKSGLLHSEKHINTLREEYDALSADMQGTINVNKNLMSIRDGLRAVVRRIEKLLAAGKCGQCGQKVSDTLSVSLSGKQRKLRELNAQIDKNIISHQSQAKKCNKIQSRIAEWDNDVRDINIQLNRAYAIKKQAQEGMEGEKRRNSAHEKKIIELTRELKKTKKAIKVSQAQLQELEVDLEMYEYAKKTLSRSGMPLYLASALIPMLNKSAEEFSEIFTQGKIKVIFDIIDSEFDVQILNPSGSQNSDGQSVGEAAMAGIVTAFSLRQAAPKTNLLILDEPGAGLDPTGAKQFANGLIQLAGMWEDVTILVTTHNSVIEGILEGAANVWTVVKEKGVSRLEM